MRREFQFTEKKMRLKFMLKGCCSIFIPTLLKIVMKKSIFCTVFGRETVVVLED